MNWNDNNNGPWGSGGGNNPGVEVLLIKILKTLLKKQRIDLENLNLADVGIFHFL